MSRLTLAPTYRAMLATTPSDWGRFSGAVKITKAGHDKLQALGLTEFRQIVDPNHTDTRFRPGLLGQVRLTAAGRAFLANTKEGEG